MFDEPYGSICDPLPKAMAHLIIAGMALNDARSEAEGIERALYAQAVKSILTVIDAIEAADELVAERERARAA